MEMFKSNSPEFKKIDKIVNGELVELFFINDKAVDSSTYYSLIEDTMELPYVPVKQEFEYNTENTKTVNTDDVEVNLTDNQTNYVNSIIDMINDTPDDAFNIILKELTFQNKLGYMTGQKLLNKAFYRAMKSNYKKLDIEIDTLLQQYDRD